MINNFMPSEARDSICDELDRDEFESRKAMEEQRTNVFLRFKPKTSSWMDFSYMLGEIYPYLVPGCDFTVPELMGSEYSQELSPLNRRMAVLFLKQEAKDHPGYLKETTRHVDDEICFQVVNAN